MLRNLLPMCCSAIRVVFGANVWQVLLGMMHMRATTGLSDSLLQHQRREHPTLPAHPSSMLLCPPHTHQLHLNQLKYSPSHLLGCQSPESIARAPRFNYSRRSTGHAWPGRALGKAQNERIGQFHMRFIQTLVQRGMSNWHRQRYKLQRKCRGRTGRRKGRC